MALKQQPISRTPFQVQANVLASVLRTNPLLSDEEKVSLMETVGALTWLNQLQISWETTKTQKIPAELQKHLFEGRLPQKLVVQT
jgi:hypothetical protein